MELKRVVVTGLGALTPIGNNVQDYWNSLLNGVSGAAPITRFDATHFKTKFACEVKNFNPTDFIDRKEARKMDPFTQYAVVAADEAWVDSGLDVNSINLDKAGVIGGQELVELPYSKKKFQTSLLEMVLQDLILSLSQK